jgi:hypothetical protein
VSSCEKVWLFGTTGYKKKMPLVRHAAVGVNWVNRLKVPTLVPEAGKQTEKNRLRPSLNDLTNLDLKPQRQKDRI